MQCDFKNCKHISDLENDVRRSEKRASQAEAELLNALDRDDVIGKLRKELHAQDDKIKLLSDVLSASKSLITAWDNKRPLAWQPEHNTELIKNVKYAIEKATDNPPAPATGERIG